MTTITTLTTEDIALTTEETTLTGGYTNSAIEDTTPITKDNSNYM